MDLTDAELVRLSTNGNEEAFEKLLDKYEGKIFNLAYRMLGNVEDAEDATQDAFMKAYSSLSGFRGDSSFSTWLYRIAKNVCLDEIRRRQRNPVHSLDKPIKTDEGDQLERQIEDDSPTPEDTIVTNEQQVVIEKAMQKLPAHHRTVIIFRDIEGFSYSQIAEILDVKLGTVKSRLYRARNNLKVVLEEMELFQHRGVNQPERREEA